MIVHSISWWCKNGAPHRKNFDTPPLKGSCGESARIREQQPARSTSYEQYGFVRLRANPCDFIRKREGTRMALVNDDSIADRARKLESLRMTNVSSRLTRRETDHLDELAKKHRLQRGEFIRQLILDELARDSGDPPVSPELVEIIGVRLMLTNLLKPLTTGQKITPDVFDGIIAEVKKHKRSLAIKTRTDLEKA